MRRIFDRLWWWRHGEQELDEEIREHLALETERQMRLGLSEAEARHAARRAFGGVGLAREDSRAVWSFLSLETWLADLRCGVRAALRHPGFTLVAALSLALGIAANAALFRVVDAVLLRQLPVPHPEQLLLLEWTSGTRAPSWWDGYRGGYEERGGVRRAGTFSTEAFESFRKSRQAVAAVVAFSEIDSLTIQTVAGATLGSGQYVSGNYWRDLGLTAAAGRLLDDTDDRPDAEPAVVISYAYWQRQFNGAPSTVGARLALNNLPFTIVGVAPRGFAGTLDVGASPDVFVPIATQPRVQPSAHDDAPIEVSRNPRHVWLRILARRRPSAGDEAVRAELAQAFDQHLTSTPPSSGRRERPTLGVTDGSGGLADRRAALTPALWSLVALSAIVYLVACANVAGLLVARGTTRARDISLRLALGAGRWRVVRQLVTESAIVGAVGAGVGLVAGLMLRPLFRAILEDPVRALVIDLAFDARMALFTGVASLVACLAVSLGPALMATRIPPSASIRQGGPAITVRRPLLGRLLVGVQIALVVPLLFDAGLLVRTVANLHGQALGFDADRVLTFRLDTNTREFDGDRRKVLSAAILDGLTTLPGVTAAAYSVGALVGDEGYLNPILVPGAPSPRRSAAAEGLPSFHGADMVWIRPVGGRFFDVFRMPLLAGRAFDQRDTATSRPVAIINESLARSFFGDRNPVGREILMGRRQGRAIEVVGVVKDARTDSLRRPIPPTLFQPYVQTSASGARVTFEVRTVGDPYGIVAAVRTVVAAVDPRVPISQVGTQADRIAQAASRERSLAQAAVLFSVLAVVLACVGLYGTLSYAVARRTGEIGIRMALGAGRAAVIRTVMAESLAVLGAGLLVGSALALASGRLVAAQLFGLAPRDPLTLAAAEVLLVMVALAAAFVPARRASRIDPLTALRYE